MSAQIIVDSEFGSTARIAETIADGLESLGSAVVQLGTTDTARDTAPQRDLLGGPTMYRRLSPRRSDEAVAAARVA